MEQKKENVLYLIVPLENAEPEIETDFLEALSWLEIYKENVCEDTKLYRCARLK